MKPLVALALLLAACSTAPAATRATPPARTATPTLFITTTAPTPSPTAPAFRYVAIGASDTVGVGASDPRTGSWPARIAAAKRSAMS